jgi:isocitrate lyase
MRADMAAYDADPRQYTQSLGCWHGFIGQQKLIAIKKHFGTTKRRYLYLSGWMVAALRSEVRPAARPVDAREDLGARPDRGALHLPAPGRRRELALFRELDEARAGR